RAVSPRYTKCSRGNSAASALRTVSPPTPESNTPMGASLTRPPGSPDLRLQMREENHVADGGGVGKEHHQSIDADAEARGRGQSVLESTDIVGVIKHRLFVALVLTRHLRPETRGLVLRVIQLREAVGNLAAADEELEAVGQERVGIIRTRQGRHFGRVGVHESRVHEGVLGGLLENLDLQL